MRTKTAKALLDKVQKDYGTIASSFSQTRNRSWKEFNHFEPYFDYDADVLDVGCGNGRLYTTFLQGKSHGSYTGVDVANGLLDEARQLIPDPAVAFVEGSVLSLPFSPGSFDAVFSVAMLHHMPEPFQVEALMEMKRVMCYDGHLFLTVWNLRQKKYRPHFRRAFSRSLYTLGSYGRHDLFIPWQNKVERYYYAFTPERMRMVCDQAGLRIVKEDLGPYNYSYVCRKKN